jgi:predicted transcriptional regulator
MTIADHIREETRELITLQLIKGLSEKNVDDKFIADVTDLPLKKVQDIIQKIKDSSN